MNIAAVKYMLIKFGHHLNTAVSFAVFCFLDLLDALLCIIYKLLDYAFESECKPCYCCSTTNKISAAKFQLKEISNTVYSRQSTVSNLMKTVKSGAFINITSILNRLQGQNKHRRKRRVPRWSDCDCKTCNSWSSSMDGRFLFVHVEDSKGGKPKEDVVFIHGFVSSSTFWTETVFPNLDEETRMNYRLLAVDLLGFGKSPKPSDSLYTLEEHLMTIEQSLELHKVSSFHIVAHSLGSILSVALAARHPESVKSLTLVAPPYFSAANGEERAQVVMRQIAPRRMWPPMAFGVSMACWYEHISRTICLLLCKNHRLWERIVKLVTLNKTRTFLIEGFFCHTHNAAWHTLHNIICGSGDKMDLYLDMLREKLSCSLTVFHGDDDTLIPVNCSYRIRSKVPRARVIVIDNEDHLSIVLGRQMDFARELVEIWKYAD